MGNGGRERRNLKSDSLIINFDLLAEEVSANGGLRSQAELVVDIANKQGSLANSDVEKKREAGREENEERKEN